MRSLDTIILLFAARHVPSAIGAVGGAHEAHFEGKSTTSNSISPGHSGPTPHTTVTITSSSDPLPRHEALHDLMTQKQFDATGWKSQASIGLIGTSYIAQVTIGTQTIPLLVDTGSADLWVAPSTFVCLDEHGSKMDQSTCGFPGLFEGTWSGGAVPDEYLSIHYGNGQYLYGPYGRESVTLGGITIPDQNIALPSEGFFKVSSGDFSGILGLGYPAMIAARKGKEPKKYTEDNTDPYAEHDTWLFNAIKRNLTEPMFSLALNLNGDGLLGIGGIVDVPVKGDFASTPILMVRSSCFTINGQVLSLNRKIFSMSPGQRRTLRSIPSTRRTSSSRVRVFRKSPCLL